MFSMETNGKHQENTGCPWELMENNKKKQQFFVGTYGKQLENICVPQKPIDHIVKTHVFRGNQWKTQRKHMFSVGTYGKHYENLLCLCFAYELTNNICFIMVFAFNPQESLEKTSVLLFCLGIHEKALVFIFVFAFNPQESTRKYGFMLFCSIIN